MHRTWQIWLTFAASLVAMVGAVGWLSFAALESDRAEATALVQAALEENVNLALWRMDSLVTPLVVRENAWSPLNYRPWLAETGAGRSKPIDLSLPPRRSGGPLLVPPPHGVRLHFQIDSQGQLSSPEVPPATALRLSGFASAEVDRNRELLARMEKLIDVKKLLDELPQLEPATDSISSLTARANDPPYGVHNQSGRAENEFQARQRSAVSNNANALTLGSQNTAVEGELLALEARASAMIPHWLDGELVLLRRAVVKDRTAVQVCWLDWPVIERELLDEVSDLLPHANVQPISDAGQTIGVRRLASLPVQLIPGPLPAAAPPSGMSPLSVALLIAWVALAVAAVAVAALLHGAIALAERRAAFVSAVTHELRTPLTTFRMYAEMLSEGMVDSEDDRRTYLRTLRVEAERLTHLVANVLSYARLERRRIARPIAVNVGEMLAVATQRLADRAATAQLALSVEPADGVLDRRVCADPAIVEQILFNLVDNACKYAAAADNRALHVSVDAYGRYLRLRVCDHGPGVAKAYQRHLFRPFRKSAQDAAHSAPGVGLGLALCRRLAREMGGDLRHEALAEGACFSLLLRLEP